METALLAIGKEISINFRTTGLGTVEKVGFSGERTAGVPAAHELRLQLGALLFSGTSQNPSSVDAFFS